MRGVKERTAPPGLRSGLAVSPRLDPQIEVRDRVAFLRAYLVASRQRSLWLAVSGGVDSALTGRLASLAVAAANRDGGAYRFVAVRLPHGKQRDAGDAERVLEWIEPSEVVSVNIASAVRALEASLPKDRLEAGSETARDYARGNTKARVRMAVQYHLANLEGGLVVGTDHSAEALVGFFTKFGDGGVDVCPLFGLSKRQVRRLATHLGAPEAIVAKAPTADLEDLRPGLPDEEALGISYQAIDDYLEGLPVPAEVADRIDALYRATEHKRRTP
ncbi:MAG: ammonia-dependent NAD(+) synthetase, partial [Acidobacteria bacterium]|nr:ammonia-dependent NAD(+) synthetase [Acidobacteriota bacterium]